MKIHAGKCRVLLATLCVAGTAYSGRPIADAGRRVPKPRALLLYILKHPGDVDDFVFGADGRTLLCASEAPQQQQLNGEMQAKVYLTYWNVASGKTVRRITLRRTHSVERMALSPDGRMVAVSTYAYSGRDPANERVTVLDTRTGRELHVYAQRRGCLAFSRDSRSLAIGDYAQDTGPAVFLYDTRTWRLHRTFAGFHYGTPQAVAFSADGTLLASLSVGTEGGAELVVWDARTGKRLRWFEDDDRFDTTDNGLVLSFVGDGRTLMVGSRLLDFTQPKSRPKRFVPPSDIGVVAVYTGNGDVAVVDAANYGSIEVLPVTGPLKLWDIRGRKWVGKWTGFTGAFYPIAISPNGEFVATGGTGRVVKIWRRQ